MQKPLIFAHRGNSSMAPENTMAAFKLAVKLRCEGIETDVHLTKDGRLAVIHDESTMRTTGTTGAVGDMTMDELKALDAGSWFDDGFSRNSIPELWELLELIKPTAMILNIELKNSIRRYPGLEQAALMELGRYSMLDRVVFSSFNHASMALMKAMEPHSQTALLYDEVIYRPAEYALVCHADGLHPQHIHVDEKYMEQAMAHGIKVRPWTVDDMDEAKRLAALGVDAIITNCPEDLMRL